MVDRSVDCKEPVDLHDDDGKATIDICIDPKIVLKATVVKFSCLYQGHMQDDLKEAVSTSDRKSNKVVDLEDMNRSNLLFVIVVSDNSNNTIDDSSQRYCTTGSVDHGIRPEERDLDEAILKLVKVVFDTNLLIRDGVFQYYNQVILNIKFYVKVIFQFISISTK